jgi:hypothetical protein
MSRKCSRSKENGFLAIPYSWNKLLGHNTRSYLKKVDRGSGPGGGGAQSRCGGMSILSPDTSGQPRHGASDALLR